MADPVNPEELFSFGLTLMVSQKDKQDVDLFFSGAFTM